MINSELAKLDATAEDEKVRQIVGSGSGGAIALAGITTAIVILIWFAFYLLVFVPRASVP
jgi:hypothetical protein